MAVESIYLTDNAIMIAVSYEAVDGQIYVIPCILDTGDAIGPVFQRQDANLLGLKREQEIGVSGAGGATTNYATTVTVRIGNLKWENEPAAIDDNLQGYSLIGLPFFLKNCSSISFDFENEVMDLESK